MKTTLRHIWLQLLLVCFTSGALYAQTTNDKIGALGGVIDVSSTGAAQYAIPIDCPSGLNGMQPSLSITYNSQGGDGFLGMGWDIGGLSAIFRGSVNNGGELWGIDFSFSDGYHLDGNRLVNVTFSESREADVYKTEVETFHLIEGFGSIDESSFISTGNEWFRVSTKDGKTMEYGRSSEHRFVPDEDTGKKAPYMWLLNSVCDRNGDYIKYNYTKMRNRPYLSKITYGNDFTSDETEIQFSHAERLSGEHLSYIAGRKVYNDYYCSEIKVVRSGQVLYTFSLNYKIEEATGIPFLTSIEKKYSDGHSVPRTYINWGNHFNALSHSSIGIYAGLDDPTFTACDINGDGLDDLIALYYEDNYYKLSRYINETGTAGERTFINKGVTNNLGTDILFNDARFQNSGSMLADINGDGVKEFISTRFNYVDKIANYVVNIYNADDLEKGHTFKLGNSYEAPAMVCADFNNDGYDEMLFIEDKKSDGSYPAKMICFKDGGYSSKAIDLSFKLPEPARAIYASDYDNNGKIDLLILTKKSYYFFDNIGGYTDEDNYRQTVFQAAANNTCPSGLSTSCYAVRPGDFNGDGIEDYLCNGDSLAYQYTEKDETSGSDRKIYYRYNNWNLMLSNGNFGFTSYTLSGLPVYQMSIESSYPYLDLDIFRITKWNVTVADIDHDGRSEAVVSDFRIYKDDTEVSWFAFNGNNFECFRSFSASKNYNKKQGSNCTGDFDGDGMQDLFSYKSSLYSEVDQTASKSYICFPSYCYFDCRKVTDITDGMQKSSKITYRSLSAAKHTDGSSFYTKTARKENTYTNLHVPLVCVSHIEESIPEQTISDTDYSYKDLVFGLNGKRLYGFASMGMLDKINGITNERKVEREYIHGFVNKETSEMKTTEGQLISSSVTNTSVTENKYKDSHEGGLLWAKYNYTLLPLKNVSKNYLMGVTNTTDYQYDSNGNLTYSKSSNSSATEEQQIEYVSADWHVPYLPSKQTTVRTANGGTHTRVSEFVYNNMGNLVKTVSDPGHTNSLTTEYSDFTSYGLPRKENVTGSGVSRGSSTVYTSDGRFAASITNGLGETTTYDYDRIRLLLKSVTTRIGTTSYEYDGWGRLTKETSPLGIKSWHGIHLGTATGLDNSYYYKTSQTEGEGEVTVWYDRLGRELRSGHYGLNGKMVWTDTEYDSKGNLYRVSQPYFAGSAPQWAKTLEYDRYGRVSSETTLLGTTTYAYDKVNTTVTSPQGTTVTEKNSAGQTLRQTTYGKSVDYVYYPSGLLKTATPEGGQAVSMEYDLQGNRTLLKDPDGGKITSTYNAFGELLQEVQPVHKMEISPEFPGGGTSKPFSNSVVSPEGGLQESYTQGTVVTQYSYLPSGLPDKIERNGRDKETIEHYYDEYNRITGIGVLNKNGEALSGRTFGYDEFDRVVNTVEVLDGGNVLLFNTQSYDMYGRPETCGFNDKFSINNGYDEYGNLYILGLTFPNSLSSAVIWYAKEANAMGQLTKVQKGTQNVNYGYDNKGFLTSIKAPGTSYSYIYNNLGQLTSRTDLLTSQSDRFVYDGQNRLQNWGVYSMGTLRKSPIITYDNSTGNIVSRNDIGGTFSYGENKAGPHALTSINLKPSEMPDVLQKITYTDAKKVKTITQGDKSLKIAYGYDGNRCKEEYSSETNNFIRYYGNNMEEEHFPDGTVRTTYYLYAGSELVGVYIHNYKSRWVPNPLVIGGEENKPPPTGPLLDKWELYFAQTDNQGSLISLFNGNGTVAQKFAYDPWGKRRNPSRWDLTDTRTEWLVNRGYTMHQHLDAFGLINMNGRVYDPVLGMFLSPDPYIQAPDNWLNYNRYSYCLNNPMMYTDPSGEFWQMLIAGFIGGLSNWMSNGHELSWKGLGYFGVGAVSAVLSASIGSGVANMFTETGTFGGGFLNSFSAFNPKIFTNGFLSGFASGGAGGSVGGFVAGFGNSLLDGNGFKKSLGDGGLMGLKAGATAAVTTGITSGIAAAADGRSFWDGSTVTSMNLPQVYQPDNSAYCRYSTFQSEDIYFNGSTQNLEELVNKYPGVISNDQQLQKMYLDRRMAINEYQRSSTSSDSDVAKDIASFLKQNKGVSYEMWTPGGAHATGVNKVRIYPSGRFKIHLMNPARGGTQYIKNFEHLRKLWHIQKF